MSYNKSSDDNVYRVFINKDKNSVEVICIGMERVDNKIEGTYSDVDELPDWMRERLAVLMVSRPQPPTVSFDGCGRRIDENTFWVVQP